MANTLDLLRQLIRRTYVVFIAIAFFGVLGGLLAKAPIRQVIEGVLLGVVGFGIFALLVGVCLLANALIIKKAISWDTYRQLRGQELKKFHAELLGESEDT